LASHSQAISFSGSADATCRMTSLARTRFPAWAAAMPSRRRVLVVWVGDMARPFRWRMQSVVRKVRHGRRESTGEFGSEGKAFGAGAKTRAGVNARRGELRLRHERVGRLERPHLVGLAAAEFEAEEDAVAGVQAVEWPLDSAIYRIYTEFMSSKRLGRGRPPKEPGQIKSEALLLRLGPDEKKGFADAANLAGVPLTVWMRERLRKVAADELVKASRPVAFLTGHPT
jgi:hypothetical protein